MLRCARPARAKRKRKRVTVRARRERERSRFFSPRENRTMALIQSDFEISERSVVCLFSSFLSERRGDREGGGKGGGGNTPGIRTSRERSSQSGSDLLEAVIARARVYFVKNERIRGEHSRHQRCVKAGSCPPRGRLSSPLRSVKSNATSNLPFR